MSNDRVEAVCVISEPFAHYFLLDKVLKGEILSQTAVFPVHFHLGSYLSVYLDSLIN